mgnify:CR=1 FL=1
MTLHRLLWLAALAACALLLVAPVLAASEAESAEAAPGVTLSPVPIRVMCSRSATPTKILSCSRVMPDLLAPMIGKGDQSHQPKITVIPIRYTDRSFQNVDNRLTFIDQFGNRAIKHRSLEWIEDQSFDTRIPTAFAVHRHAAHQPLRDTVGAI